MISFVHSTVAIHSYLSYIIACCVSKQNWKLDTLIFRYSLSQTELSIFDGISGGAIAKRVQ